MAHLLTLLSLLNRSSPLLHLFMLRLTLSPSDPAAARIASVADGKTRSTYPNQSTDSTRSAWSNSLTYPENALLEIGKAPRASWRRLTTRNVYWQASGVTSRLLSLFGICCTSCVSFCRVFNRADILSWLAVALIQVGNLKASWIDLSSWSRFCWWSRSSLRFSFVP